MKHIIAGGHGFVGTHLAHRLYSLGNDVMVIDNLSSNTMMLLPPVTEVLVHDIVDPNLKHMHDFKPDVVWNLASPASPPRYMNRPIETLRTGAEGTFHMLALAYRSGAIYIHASTSEIYGDPAQHPQKETYSGNVDITSPRSVYDEAKRYGETLTHTYHRERGLDTRVARIFNTYGPGMDPTDGRVITNLLVQSIKHQPHTIYGTGEQTRSFMFIDDLIDGLMLLLLKGNHKPVNIGNPNEITINALSDIIQSRYGHTGFVHHPLPESDPVRRQPDIKRATRWLGWEPGWELTEGLEATYDWLTTPQLLSAQVL